MAAGDKARRELASYKMKARKTLARARNAAKDQQNQNTVLAVAGGSAAGALRGYGLEVQAGDYAVGWGLIAGVGLAVAGDKLFRGGKALGAGMLAGEAYVLTAEIVDSMLEGSVQDA